MLKRKNNEKVIGIGELVNTSNWHIIAVITIIAEERKANITPVINQLSQKGKLFNPIIIKL